MENLSPAEPVGQSRNSMISEDPGPEGKTLETAAPRRRILSKLLRLGLPIGAIVVLMLWISGTFRHGIIQGGRPPVPEETAVGLATCKVATQTIPATTEAVGTVQAEHVAAVSSRVVANVVEMRAYAGERVAQGETLVLLDDRDLRRRVGQAQDAARSAEASLHQARSDFNRDKPLFDQQVITPYDFEHTQTNLKTAEASLHRLQQAEQEAEVNLSYATIRSPFTGVVIDKLANGGDLAAPGKPLVSMYEQDRLWLEASVPEELLNHVRLNQPMAIRIDALGRDMRGRVVEIVPSSDPSSRTVAVRVRLNETRDIVPGMFGRLLIPTAPEEVVTIPASALIRAGQLTLVDVVDQGHVQRRTVQLGRAVGGRFEVLSGLVSGETVVLQGASASTPGR